MQDLATLSRRFDDWLYTHALPLWWEKGADHVRGGFFDLLDQTGNPVDAPRRARVQARQSWVYGVAGEMGWTGPWRHAAEQGLGFLFKHQGRSDGQFSTKAAENGAVLDTTAFLYDQTFILLALAQLHKMNIDADAAETALKLLKSINAGRRHAAGGFVESGEQPFQSNPLMHLFEAALAWCETGDHDGAWDELADELAELCLSRMIDPASGAVAEYYDAAWRPLPFGGAQHLSPGHQFEWAWLLGRWSRLHNYAGAHKAATRLFETGTRGVDSVRQVAIFEMSLDFAITQPAARLWAQAERIKAALLLMETAKESERARYRDEAVAAAAALWRYLETPVPGLWRDRMTPDGKFIEEAAPASSFYHIICAISVLRAGVRA